MPLRIFQFALLLLPFLVPVGLAAQESPGRSLSAVEILELVQELEVQMNELRPLEGEGPLHRPASMPGVIGIERQPPPKMKTAVASADHYQAKADELSRIAASKTGDTDLQQRVRRVTELQSQRAQVLREALAREVSRGPSESWAVWEKLRELDALYEQALQDARRALSASSPAP